MKKFGCIRPCSAPEKRLSRGLFPLAALAAVLLAPRISFATQASCDSESLPLDDEWSFHLGEQTHRQAPAPDDAGWQLVELPHDWAIVGPRSAENPSGGAGGFAPMGVGWYRRVLPTPTGTCRHVSIRFDGIMAHSEVWINGHLLGVRPYGYVSFAYDLSPFLIGRPGAENTLLVRADNRLQPSSRFYQGAGIYRHVHLDLAPGLHSARWTTVVTTPRIGREDADVSVKTEIVNEGETASRPIVRVSLRSRQTGAVVGTTEVQLPSLAAGSHRSYETTLKVHHPALWGIGTPNLYQATVDVQNGSGSSATEKVMFGIRESHFEPATGFWLNGQNIKIKGVALHSDIGALGMAAPLSLVRQRLLVMQQMGANAVRTAHNPVDPAILDLCDELGLLVLDEFFDMWTVAKNPYDYHQDFREWYLRDLRDTVRRDRNHPSIIAWSAGNEIHDTPHPEIAMPLLASMVQVYHELDPTRPVTQALFRPNVSHDYEDGLADMLDVIGQNYRPAEILSAHDAKPSRKILGTENTRDREAWLAVRDHPPYSGMFIWAGADYLGESRKWPLFADPGGLFDRTDYPKPEALEHESWWSEKPVVYVVRREAPTPKAPTDPGYELEQYRPVQSVFHDWTPGNLSAHIEHVEVYSNCPHVQLNLNGKLLGEKDLPEDAAPRRWDVAFETGTIQARCSEVPTVTDSARTASAPHGVRLEPQTPTQGVGFENTALVRATIVDENGTAVPCAEVRLSFAVEGPGRIVATDDADTMYKAPFEETARVTENGRAAVYIRRTANGPLLLTANGPGLVKASIDLDSLSSPTAAPFVPRHDENREAAGDSALTTRDLANLPESTDPAEIEKAMRLVAEWQVKKSAGKWNQDWTYVPLYLGLLAANDTLHDPRLHEVVLEQAENFDWKLLARRGLHAEDEAIAQVYEAFFTEHREKKRIADTRRTLDRVVAYSDSPDKDLWWWCDALFMAPAGLARLSVLTSDDRFRIAMEREWALTQAHLYDVREHLFYRDSSYFDKREHNGERVFWARGNGWVLAGLANTLQFMPENDPKRPAFVKLFTEMAQRVLSLQQADGLWRTGLLDQQAYQLPELSGSALFTYAIAWGINQGLLAPHLFQPAVERAWIGMTRHIFSDGRLGCIQPIGAAPGAFDSTSSYVYGVGAFLMAGSEIDRYKRSQHP